MIKKKIKRLNYSKSQEGITLIALVITIIVLLILAGVTINLTIGEEGIIRRAQQAVQNYTLAVEDERNKLDNYYNIINDAIGEIPETKDETPNSIAKKDENTYLIQSIEDLVILSKTANGEEGYAQDTFSGKTIELEINLDFNSEKSYIDAQSTAFGDINGNGKDEALIVELTTEKGFTPIGTYSKPFEGNIEGNNHTIFNLYIKSSSQGGFIGCTNGTIIKNLSLKDVNVSASPAGALIGRGIKSGR